MLLLTLGLALAASPFSLDDWKKTQQKADELAEKAKRPVPIFMPISSPPTMVFAQGDPMVLYLNRWGDAYTCNDEDDNTRNQSTIACSTSNGTADMGPFSGSDNDWEEILSCVQDQFSRFRLAVTDIEPLGGQYIEAAIGGTPQQAGMSGSVGGVSPFYCEVIPGAIVYIFSDIYGDDNRGICETAAQEIAHAFGFDHEFLCEDPMTYLEGCGEKTFQDAWVPCGEYETRECSCGDATQNSVAQLFDLFGPSDGTPWNPPVDNDPPTVTLTSPTANETILPANQTVQVTAQADDDAGLTVVELLWDFTGERLFCPSEGGAYSCTKEGNTYTWFISVGVGQRSFRAHVRDVAGNDAFSEDRSIWFSLDGSGPPDDQTPPAVVVGKPLSGSVLPTDVPFDVVATIVDDTGIAAAEMRWQRFGGEIWIPCPYEDERIQCTTEGTTYRWTVLSGREGDRSFQIRATDLLGNVAESEEFGITLSEGAPEALADGNDSYDEAIDIGCGETKTLVGQDADWFKLDVKPGTTVDVTVNGEDVSIVASNGKIVLGEGKGTAQFETGSLGEGEFADRFGVVPPTASHGAVEVSIQCQSPATEQSCLDFGCGATGSPALFALALLGFVRRRRKM